MDSELLARLVKGCLAECGSASLPGLGVFSLEDVPASFSDKGFTINPPYRKVVFAESDSGDNSLIRRYADANGLSIGLASSYLARLTRDMKVSLSSRHVVEMPGFGKLKAVREGIILFIPDENLSFLPQYDILEPISLKSLQYGALDSVGQSAKGGTTTVPQPATGGTAAGIAQAGDTITVAVKPRKRHGKRLAAAAITTIASAALLLGLLAVIGRTKPQWVDALLYNEEELEIINAVRE